MSKNLIGGRTWTGFKQTLEGPPPEHPNHQLPKDGKYIPLYQQVAVVSAARRQEKDPLENS